MGGDKIERMTKLQERDAVEMADILAKVRTVGTDPNTAAGMVVGGDFALSASTAAMIRDDGFIEKMGRYYEKRDYLGRTGIPFHEFLGRVQAGTWTLY